MTKKDDFTKKQDDEIEKTKEVYREIGKHDPRWLQKMVPIHLDELGLLTTAKGKNKVYTMCMENICKLLDDVGLGMDIFGFFRFDEFRQIFERRESGVMTKWRPLEDSDALFVQSLIQQLFEPFQTVTKTMVYDAIIKVSLNHKYDSAKEYVTKLEWDGTKRLDTWLTDTYGVEDNVYHRAVASNWMKGLVKRIMVPGCKFDYVMVLEGEQGCKKSMSLGVLGGDWYVETTMSTDSKDFFMQFHGKVIVEFSEGETLSRTEVKRMKAIITTQSDKYRPPYERVSKDFPRRCVFAMTTNQEEYLKDETGNRRWFPVRVVLPEANVEWLTENRDQLFAEAYHRVVTLKETCWEFPKEESLQQQKERRIKDANEDIVIDWYHHQLSKQGRLEGVTPRDAFMGAYHAGDKIQRQMNKYEEMQIATIFREGLKLIKMRKQVNNIQTNRWYSEESIATNNAVEAAMKQTMKMEEEVVPPEETKTKKKPPTVEEEVNAEIPF